VSAGLCSFLESVGYRASAVWSSAEAIEYVRDHSDIAALITDYHLANGERETRSASINTIEPRPRPSGNSADWRHFEVPSRERRTKATSS
jgi:CheY-like chemotaxis protein